MTPLFLIPWKPPVCFQKEINDSRKLHSSVRQQLDWFPPFSLLFIYRQDSFASVIYKGNKLPNGTPFLSGAPDFIDIYRSTPQKK